MTEQDRIEYFKNEILMMSSQVVDLLDERDQLMAQVELLKITGKALVSQAERAMDFDIGNYNALKKCVNDFDGAAETASQQCLAEVKAQAVRDFIQWGIQKVDPEFAEFADCAEHYISTELRQQDKVSN